MAGSAPAGKGVGPRATLEMAVVHAVGLQAGLVEADRHPARPVHGDAVGQPVAVEVQEERLRGLVPVAVPTLKPTEPLLRVGPKAMPA